MSSTTEPSPYFPASELDRELTELLTASTDAAPAAVDSATTTAHIETDEAPEMGTSSQTDITRLEDTDTGRWLVLTETSSYLLDLDERTVLRTPGNGCGSVDETPVAVSTLRRDLEPLALRELSSCEVGHRALLDVAVRADGGTTIRQTTFIRAIRTAD